MSEVAKNVLAKEAKTLEYWRRRYMAQAAIVLAAAVGAIAAVFMFIEAPMVQLLFVVGILLVASLMLGELRESLQARGEGLILAKSALLFSGLQFDYGCGIDEKNLVLPRTFDDYTVRECRNTISGEGYVLEEDWLYSVVSSKFIAINHTVFEGILLTVDVKENAAGLAQNPKVREAGEKLKRLLGAESMFIAAAERRICFCFKTDKKIFYQFRLCSPNTAGAFVRRVETVRAQAEEILAQLAAYGG